MSIVTILILIDGFLQSIYIEKYKRELLVTILILIDGFLQFSHEELIRALNTSHNPYFNRWFSAITVQLK